MQRVNDRVSYAVLLAIGALHILTFLVVRVPRAQRNYLLNIDGKGYFSYLRSVVFDGDLDFHNEYAYLDLVRPESPATGLPENSYSVGPAILWAPFYLLGHRCSLMAAAVGIQVDVNGYGLIYQSAVGIATIVYVTLGCLLTYRVCRRYFSSLGSLVAAVGVWLASSLFHYTVAAPDMSHGVSFFAVSLFLFLWHPPRSRTYKEWVLLGLSAGLVTLVRWQNLLYLSMPAIEAFYITATSSDAATRVSVLRRYLSGGAVVGVIVLLLFAPQMLVWNTLYGSPTTLPSWFTQPGRLDWLHPHLLEYLFSTRHGLYTWTPIMLLATCGLIPLGRRDLKVAVAFFIALLFQLYVNSANSDWHGSGSFGARRFVSATSLLTVAMAALTDSVVYRFRRGSVAALAAVSALVGWNLLFDLQYSWGFIPRDQAISLHELTVGKLEMILELIDRVINLLIRQG